MSRNRVGDAGALVVAPGEALVDGAGEEPLGDGEGVVPGDDEGGEATQGAVVDAVVDDDPVAMKKSAIDTAKATCPASFERMSSARWHCHSTFPGVPAWSG